VPKDRFELISGEEDLFCYQFNTAIARHYFCRHCGVKSFYVPRSNPDGFSVNVNCLDEIDGVEFKTEAFDGRNWEANAASLAELTRK
jgi:hypothetical protein